ncbi:hypothetical protein GWO43_27230 [candidate division KSB1 bacterium]|nr:hypothetical protein [candidate division KSB1 bacterium]NIR70474.1 hypothetical protein [candidate division KSB1 bacterium]NIS27652.1 hypothetical protein [candidate division KSB1 bacterium]NIT74487.1 hypothetical protein [candidate division KSB1 bacterium]NIU28333.1 hypothetical protein [candidate division KSB1 bacterium]
MADDSILKKSVLAGLGIYSLTREKAQEIVADLQKRGELSKDEGAKFVKAMMEKADEEMAYLKKVVDKQVKETISTIRPTHEDEFKKLHEKIDKLSKQVEKLSSK